MDRMDLHAVEPGPLCHHCGHDKFLDQVHDLVFGHLPVDHLGVEAVGLLRGGDILGGEARQGAAAQSAGKLEEALGAIGVDALVHLVGAVDEGDGHGGGAGEPHGGQALDPGVHAADAGDDEAHAVAGPLHIVVLEPLAESAEGVRIAHRPHGRHGGAVFQLYLADAGGCKESWIMRHIDSSLFHFPLLCAAVHCCWGRGTRPLCMASVTSKKVS